MEKDGFSWWIRRLKRAQSLFDEFRIDHFREFSGIWAVPAGAKIATFGQWKLVGHGKSLFDDIFKALGEIHIIVEDLGVITEDVMQLRKSISAPGMAVLHFAFSDGADSLHLTYNHERNQTRGWWDSLKDDEKGNSMERLHGAALVDYVGLHFRRMRSFGMILGATIYYILMERNKRRAGER